MTSDRRSHHELENDLRDLASTLELSPPDYAERVLRRLGDETGAPRRAARPTWTVRSTAMRRLVTATAALLIAALLTLAVPGGRQAVASWFEFVGIDIRSAPTRSTPAPVTPVTPAPLAAGPRVTLDQAQRAATDRVRLPANLAPPDRVFLRRDGAAVIVTLAYRTAATLNPTPDTGYALLVTEIFDAGKPGVFIAGPQEVVMLDHSRKSHGQPTLHQVSARASANTLIWGDGPTTYRLEGDFTQGVALELSASLRW